MAIAGEKSVLDVRAVERLTLRDALRALTAINQDIQLFNYGNVIVRRGYQNLKTVRLLSGGVAGTDLSHAIFVGKGMLTAAVLGEDAVPSSREILHTIKELDEGEKSGILVIIQANSDVFNFQLAVQRANENCMTRVKLLVVNDDMSEDKERYSCGFILVTKLLGAMAEKGEFFENICLFYENLAPNIVTVPLRYSQVGRISEDQNAAISVDFDKQCLEVMDVRLDYNLTLQPSVPIVALINTSRTFDRLTELGLVKQVIDKVRSWNVPLVRMYYGSFLTAVPGTAALTVIKSINNRIIEYLDATTDASGWKRVTQFLPEISAQNEIPGLLQHIGKQPVPIKGPKLRPSQVSIFETAVRFACDALISCERQLNIIDAERSAGNVGTRFRKMAEAINKKMGKRKLQVDYPYTFFKKLGIIAEATLGGTMGAIYGTLCCSAAEFFHGIPQEEYVTPFMWARAFTSAVNSMKRYWLNEQAEVTMFLPIKCCEMGISKEIARDHYYLECYGFGVSVAEEAAQKTKLENHEHPDAGAHAVGIWMRAVFEAVKLLNTDTCQNEL